MRKNKGVTLVSLVVTIIILIILAGVSINLTLGENGIITKAKETKRAQEIAEIKEKVSLEISAAETGAILRNESLEQQQLEDIVSKYGTLQEDKDTIITKKNNYEISLKEIWYGVLSESGSYTDKVKQIEILEKELAELKAKYEELEKINEGNSQILEDLRNQIATLENEKSVLEESLAKEQEKTKQQEEQIAELNDIKTKLANVTVTEDKILKDYIAYKDGELITGTMADNGAVNATLNAGGSYTIPAGYHNGNGKVTANSLASQTQATATAVDISSGKTAWVNGKLITGTNNNAELDWEFIGSYNKLNRIIELDPNTFYIVVICRYGASPGRNNPSPTTYSLLGLVTSGSITELESRITSNTLNDSDHYIATYLNIIKTGSETDNIITITSTTSNNYYVYKI